MDRSKIWTSPGKFEIFFVKQSILAETRHCADPGLLLAHPEGDALLAGDRAPPGLRALQGRGTHRGGTRQGQL